MRETKRLGSVMLVLAVIMLSIGLCTWQARSVDDHIGPYGDTDPGNITLQQTKAVVDAFLVARALAPEDILISYLRNGSSNELAVDGSSVPVIFDFVPPSGQRVVVSQVIMYLSRSMGTSFGEDEFTNLAALTNGVSIRCDGVVIGILRDNIDFISVNYDVEINGVLGGGGNLKALFNLDGLPFGASGLLCGDTLGFAFVIQDDLSSLATFRVSIGGKLVPE